MNVELRRGAIAATVLALLLVAFTPALSAYSAPAPTWGSATQLPTGSWGQISCGTSTTCTAMAAGSQTTTLNGTTWSPPTPIGLPQSDLNTGSYLSCSGPTFCVAMGSTTYATFDGHSWTYKGPVNANDPRNGTYHRYQGLSCASTQFCVAVTDDGFSATYDGNSWATNFPIPGPQVVGGGPIGLYDISCPQVNFCATGDSFDNVYTFDGATWKGYATTSGLGQGVMSCGSTSLCLGERSSNGSDLKLWDGAAWKVVHPPVIPGALLNSTRQAVCLVQKYCLALQSVFDSQGNGSWNVYVLDGSGWSSTGLTSLSGAINLSCDPTGTLCMSIQNGRLAVPLIQPASFEPIGGGGNSTPPPSEPSPTGRPPVFTTKPDASALFAPINGRSSFTVAAQDPDGGPVSLAWSALPSAPVKVTCGAVSAAPPNSSVTCTLEQISNATPATDVTFTATDQEGLRTSTKAVIGIGTYAAMGDSFSSGEGNPPYDAGTFTGGQNTCHQSSKAYGRLIERDTPALQPDTTINPFVACSGNIAVNIALGRPSNHVGPQLDSLDAGTTLVTITAGGNDMRFADILKACTVATGAPGTRECLRKPLEDGAKPLAQEVPDLRKWITLDIPCPATMPKRQPARSQYAARCDDALGKSYGTYTAPALHTLYRQVAARAPRARIYVLLYPHLFTDQPLKTNPSMTYQSAVRGQAASLFCEVGSRSGNIVNARVYDDAIKTFNAETDNVNETIRQEVVVARSTGADITAVDPQPAWSNGARGGHGLCSAQSWINTVSLKPVTARAESYHPNATGHQEFERVILAAVRARS